MKGVLGIKRVFILFYVPLILLVDGDLHFEIPGDSIELLLLLFSTPTFCLSQFAPIFLLTTLIISVFYL